VQQVPVLVVQVPALNAHAASANCLFTCTGSAASTSTGGARACSQCPCRFATSQLSVPVLQSQLFGPPRTETGTKPNHLYQTNKFISNQSIYQRNHTIDWVDCPYKYTAATCDVMYCRQHRYLYLNKTEKKSFDAV
jgi:hypothetical protein